MVVIFVVCGKGAADVRSLEPLQLMHRLRSNQR